MIEGLKRNWSPKQIAQRLPKLFPCDQSMRVSHETIYRSLFIQARGGLKKQLVEHLRSGAGCAVHALLAQKAKVKDKSSVRCRFASAPPKRRIERCRVIGKAI